MQELDFVELIETNPITKFSGNYNNKILNKIQSNFTDFEQHLFISSFYCYLNYDKTKDFVVDLDNIWKWLGFSSKFNANVVLDRYFKIEEDYLIAPVIEGAIFKGKKGGQNIKKIMMNVRCFKSLCLKAQTKKASQIHEYYIKLEEMIQEVVAEENDELKLQLKLKDDELIQKDTELIQKDTEIIQNNIQFNINLCRNREKTLIESYKNKSVIYLAHISGDDYKFGITTNIERRVHDHKADFGPSFILLLAFESTFYSKIENKVKTELKDKIYAKIFNEQRRVELIKINESFTQEMFYNKIQVYHKHFIDTIIIETQEREIVEKDREILELKNAIIELSKTQNNNNNNNGIIIIPEIIPQELPQHEDIMDKKARQKLKKAIRDKAYREKNKEIIKIKSALHYQEKKNK